MTAGKFFISSAASRWSSIAIVLLDLSVLKNDDALGVLRDVRFVRDQHERDAAFAIQPLKYLHHFNRSARIEIAGRLVRQNQCRIVDQRARDRDALLLAA